MRLIEGVQTSIDGKQRDISKYGTFESLGRFLGNKARPDIAAIVKVAIAAIDSGKDPKKVRVTPGEALQSAMPVPLALQEVIAVMRDRGLTEGAIIQVLAEFGMGVSTYEDRDKGR
jgi:hypothetical protein